MYTKNNVTNNKNKNFQDIKSFCKDIDGEFPYPIIADPNRQIAVALDMIDEEQIHDIEIAKTVRALYIISPDRKLRLSMVYPITAGHNVELVLLDWLVPFYFKLKTMINIFFPQGNFTGN